MIYVSVYTSPMGKITLAATGDGLLGAWIEGQKYFWGKIEEKEIIEEENKHIKAAKKWLDAYFAGAKPDISSLDLCPRGSEFAQIVWKLLMDIPYGKTITYGELAKKVAELRGLSKMSAQAIGGAVGHNPISIIIPCHRVVGTSGSLTGYAGGIHLKVKLLEHENVDMTKFFLPAKGTAL